MPNPTLSLAMIVRDEEESLPRCLKSVEGVFDEIIIVDSGSKDKTKEIATSFGSKIYDFVWIEDFSAARNFAFSKATCQFVMWLDADDEVLPKDREKILALKPKLGEYDAYLMEYNYSQDQHGNSTLRLFRHRILKNNPPPRWAAPIHECMLIPSEWRQLKTDIVVTHRRTERDGVKDAGRNMRIIKKAVEADPNDQRMRYYYGKELSYTDQNEEAIKQLSLFLEKPAWHEDMVDALIILSRLYVGMGRIEDAVKTCVKGIETDPRWAEFYVRLGDIYYDKQDWAKAAHWFEIAVKTKMPDSWGMVNTSSHTWLPHDRLSICYDRLGRRREANEENEIVLKYLPGDQRVLNNQAYYHDVLFDRQTERPYRLNLGAGQKPVPSYRNCDLFPGGRVEFAFDMRKLPYHDSTVHAIYSEHALEQAGDHESVRGAIKEWARALRHGGHLTLNVLDLELCCIEFVRADDCARKSDERWTSKEWYRYTIYGIQQGTEPGDVQSKRTGFTKGELRRLLEENGFRIDYLDNYDGWGTPSIEARAVQVVKPIRVRWLIRGRENMASDLRLRDISRWLAANGLDSDVCKAYESGSTDVGPLVSELRKYDIVVFTQCSKADIELADHLNRCGVSTVFNLDKTLNGQPDLMTMADTAKVIMAQSAVSLMDHTNRTVILIDDGIQAIAEVGLRWTVMADMLCSENCNPPKVDIIIPTFNNLPYLRECVESIRKNTDWPHNIIVVNSGTDGTADWLRAQPDIISVNSSGRLHFSAANNVGLKAAREKYVCLLNDDTIVSRNWLGALMHEAMKPNVGAVGPFSNCDRGWIHNDPIVISGKDLVCGMVLDQVKDIIPEIYKWEHKKEVYPREWLPFYCAVIPRAAIDKVGLLDEGFRSGDEDVDYCRRLTQAGYVFRQTNDSFVFHFGGRTRYAGAKGIDVSRHEIEDSQNHGYYFKKWGDLAALSINTKQRAQVLEGASKRVFVLYTGHAWERWSPKSINNGGIGGSETCAVHVAREFARSGWKSYVFNDCAGMEGNYDGVEYIDHNKLQPFLSENKIDLFVSSRRPDVFGNPMSAMMKVLWVHDIWADSNPAANLYLDKIDKIFVLSPWHKKFFMKHHAHVPEEKIHITRNGIDLDRFSGKIRKVPGRLIYPSCPNRGLETLLDLMPAIRRHVPDIELHVFYGFDNWEKSARNDQEMLKVIERIKGRLREPGVIYRGRIGQAELAVEFMKAELWAYPTWFPETFCITACEAMAAGTPIVTTNVAALDTTVGDVGVCIDVPKGDNQCGDTIGTAFRERFVEESVRMLTDRNRWEEYSKRGLERARVYSWNSIVDEWLSALAQETRERV